MATDPRYAHLSDGQLEAALRLPAIAEAKLEEIRTELAARRGLVPGAVIGQATSAPKGRQAHPAGVMDANEQRMAEQLELRRALGEVRRWWFEAMTFRIGRLRCWYKVDFLAERADGVLEGIEVKGPRAFKAKEGAVHAAGRVKFAAAAELYPFIHWRQLQWTGAEWRTVREFAPAR